MAETAKLPCPPYATFAPFLNLLNKLRDTQVPSRIDPSVFKNASGSLVYSVIAALKILKLIAADGTPTQEFSALVKADDEARKGLLRAALPAAYPTLFDGTFDITKATSGQFDEHIREHYEAKGSTVDKVASFFIAATNFAEVELSQLVKDRSPTSSSPASGKSRKQRKAAQESDLSRGNSGGGGGAAQTPAITEKALEYRLVDLMSDAINQPEVMQAIITVITFLKSRDAEPKKAADPKPTAP